MLTRTLRSRVIRLAYEKPELRSDLLDLLVGRQRRLSSAQKAAASRRRKAPMRVRKAPIDSLVTFRHDGQQVVATVARTEWRGPGKPMLYIWKTSDGREISTDGLPPDTEVVRKPVSASTGPGAELVNKGNLSLPLQDLEPNW